VTRVLEGDVEDVGQPEDVVPFILFLVGEGAEHITGQVYSPR
jgi:hypothetical protein